VIAKPRSLKSRPYEQLQEIETKRAKVQQERRCARIFTSNSIRRIKITKGPMCGSHDRRRIEEPHINGTRGTLRLRARFCSEDALDGRAAGLRVINEPVKLCKVL